MTKTYVVSIKTPSVVKKKETVQADSYWHAIDVAYTKNKTEYPNRANYYAKSVANIPKTNCIHPV